MSSSPNSLICGMPRRPKIAEASASAILWAIAGGLIAGPASVWLGGNGNVENQRQPLEMAVREFLQREGFEVVFFYPAPQSAKVTFRNGSGAYWTIESKLPESLQSLPQDDIQDWLYGNFVNSLLPATLNRVRRIS